MYSSARHTVPIRKISGACSCCRDWSALGFHDQLGRWRPMPASLKTMVCRACQIRMQGDYATEILARRRAEGYAARAKRTAEWAAQSAEWAAFVGRRTGRAASVRSSAPPEAAVCSVRVDEAA